MFNVNVRDTFSLAGSFMCPTDENAGEFAKVVLVGNAIFDSGARKVTREEAVRLAEYFGAPYYEITDIESLNALLDDITKVFISDKIEWITNNTSIPGKGTGTAQDVHKKCILQ